MILPMKKISIVVLDRNREGIVEKMRNLGVIHIQSEGNSSETIDELKNRREELERVSLVFPQEASKDEEEGRQISYSFDRAWHICMEVSALDDEARSLRDDLEKLAREEARLFPWGHFDPDDLRDLRAKGIDIKLYTCSPEEFERYFKDKRVFVISRTKTQVRFAAVFTNDKDVPEITEEEIPEKGLEEIQKRLKLKLLRLDEIQMQILGYAKEREQIVKAIEELDERIEFEQVKADLSEEGKLAFISGFVPEEKMDNLREAASKNGWALLIRDPDGEEQPPTEVKNPRFVGIIQPVFSLLGITPGYKELDISFWFLSFFTVFFAMIIGDAGYGSILLAGSLYFAVKGKKKYGKVSDGNILMILLSFATIAWGAITGNWFGVESIGKESFLSNLVIPSLLTFQPRSAQLVKIICFILGTVQLSIAHLWNFFAELREKPRIKAFAQLGWLSTVLGLYYLVLNLVIDPERFPMPDYSHYMIAAGIIAVFLFSKQEGHFFKGIIRGLADFIPTALDGVSAFSDIISYIRLFAVGLASLEIAKSFNSMAEGFGSGPIAIIAGAVILVFGHSLNLAMGALSVIVHGVRLNMLEFSSHLGMEWTGYPYRPFQKKESTA